MERKKHPDKHIEKAVKYAEDKGWVYREAGKSAHAWGKLYCPLSNKEGCKMSIWSTPRDPVRHAKQIKRNVDKCKHCGGLNES